MKAFDISEPHISTDSKTTRPTVLLPNSWFAANPCQWHEADDLAAIKVIAEILPHSAGPTETEMLPRCQTCRSQPSCSAWSSWVEEQSVRQAAAAAVWHYCAPTARQPPRCIYVIPKATSPCCFYPHISMIARADAHTSHFSLCPLKADKELLSVNSINSCWLYTAFAYSSYSPWNKAGFYYSEDMNLIYAHKKI